MTAIDPPQPHLCADSALAPPHLAPPRLDLPWMQALIAAGAGLSDPDLSDGPTKAHAGNAVHYIRCGTGPECKEAGTDFLTAVSRARSLVATGATRIVFLTPANTPDCALRHSLLSFSRHAGRAVQTRPTEFTVIPVIKKQTD